MLLKCRRNRGYLTVITDLCKVHYFSHRQISHPEVPYRKCLKEDRSAGFSALLFGSSPLKQTVPGKWGIHPIRGTAFPIGCFPKSGTNPLCTFNASKKGVCKLTYEQPAFTGATMH